MRLWITISAAALVVCCNANFDLDSVELRAANDGAADTSADVEGDADAGCQDDAPIAELCGAACGPTTITDACQATRTIDCEPCACACAEGTQCFQEGDPHPTLGCSVCDATEGWVGNVGASCDDGDLCTEDDVCDAAMACAGTAKMCPSTECAAAGTCNAATGACEHDAINEGAACTDDGLDCTDDVCGAGQCQHPRKNFRCVINGSCAVDGDANPVRDCEICDVASDPFTWSVAPDGRTCSTGVCTAGACG